MDPKKPFFVRRTLEKNKINKSFKIDQKLHTKHHQIDQKTCKFDRFCDVWYAVFKRKKSKKWVPRIRQSYSESN